MLNAMLVEQRMLNAKRRESTVRLLNSVSKLLLRRRLLPKLNPSRRRLPQ